MRPLQGSKAKTACLTGLALGAMLVTAACSSGSTSKSSGSEIVFAESTDLESVDPGNMVSLSALRAEFLMYDTLVTRNAQGKLIPDLATSWTLKNKTNWIFTIRKGVKFQDGSPLTATDVAYSINRIIDPANHFSVVAQLGPVKTAVAVDDTTVRVETTVPDALLPSRMQYAGIVPSDYMESVGEAKFIQKPVGSGPYKFVEWKRQDRLVLSANPDYWGGKPNVQSVVLRTITDASDRVAALRTGEADIVDNIPPSLDSSIDGQSGLALKKVRSTRVVFIGMNAEVKPLDSPKVRQALNYAVDKASIMKNVMQDQAYSHDGKYLMYGPLINGFDPSVQDYKYDPAKAKQLLAEAGYPNGFSVGLDVSTGRYDTDVPMVTAIASQLAQVGVDVKIHTTDWGTYYPRLIAGKLTGLFLLDLGNSYMDAGYYFDTWLSSRGETRGYFHTPETDKLTQAIDSEMNPKARLSMLKNATRELVQNWAPWIFLFDRADVYGVDGKVSNWSPRPDELMDFAKASVD